MGSRNKERRCLGPIWLSQILNKKRRKNNKRASSAAYKRKRSQHVRYFEGELKDMRMLSSNDEAFHLSWLEIAKIIDIIHKRKTPTPKTYTQWDEYAVSFYLKMCNCFGVDYQHLEATSDQDDHDDDDDDQTSTKEIMPLNEQEEHMEMSHEERVEQLKHMEISGCNPVCLMGPFEFGSYSSGTTPDRIPYHLYLLVKEAVDIMNNTSYNQTHLTRAEEKIRFFCTYFHSHLPTGWNYERDSASSLIAGYDTMGGPRYLMVGYTPFGDLFEENLYDKESYISPQSMADVMSIIHSRKTPTFWKMSWEEISFYYKLCSCFGIDYRRLEAASEEDVCLMITGRNG